MSLIECPDCRKEVSTLATACPGCGRPVSTFSINENKAHQTIDSNKSDAKKTSENEALKAFILSGAITC